MKCDCCPCIGNMFCRIEKGKPAPEKCELNAAKEKLMEIIDQIHLMEEILNIPGGNGESR